MRPALLVVAIVALASPVLAAQPSFDCAKATHEIEQLVCKSDALAALDNRMFSVFTRALATVKADAGATKLLRAEQREWIKSRDDCWKAADRSACTTLTYKKRIAELQAVYGLVPAYARVVYTCDGDPASELVARIYRTDPEVTLVERNHRTVTTYQTISADGARFEGGNTVYWDKGRDAMVTWDGKDMQCTQRRAK
jgi:uncharacterized protein